MQRQTLREICQCLHLQYCGLSLFSATNLEKFDCIIWLVYCIRLSSACVRECVYFSRLILAIYGSVLNFMVIMLL